MGRARKTAAVEPANKKSPDAHTLAEPMAATGAGVDASAPLAPRTLTPQQQAALTTRDVSVALSAGAGCGKTFVLTARYLSYLDPATHGGEPLELGQIVAITFTERAAREMRTRIRQKVEERLRGADDGEAVYWTGVLRQLEGARISTFHSFCANLLRAHAVEAGLDPGFAVLDQTVSDTFLAEALQDSLRNALVAGDEDALALAEEFGLEGLQTRLRQMLADVRENSGLDWDTLSPAELAAHWDKLYQTRYLPGLVEYVAHLPEVAAWQKLAAGLGVTGVALTHQQRLSALLDELPTTTRPEELLHELRAATLLTMDGKRITVKMFSEPEFQALYKEANENLRWELDKLLKTLGFTAAAALPAAAHSLRLLRLTRRILAEYDRRKAELPGLDFVDLQSHARALLTDPARAELQSRLRAQIRVLLVDEFQDTDPIQIEILSALCGTERSSGKLFFVGDFKQSIYRFRGADPRIFLRLRAETPPAGQLPLSENFRSQPELLHFVNALFAGEFRSTGLEYEPLLPRRKQTGPVPAVEWLWTPATTHKDQSLPVEARWIARRLRQLIDEELLVSQKEKSGAMKPLAFGDIAILFRTLADSRYYEEALREAGIPYYVVGGQAFYSQQEIYDLYNLLQSVQSPAHEIALAGALRSPLFGLADATLFWLRHSGGSLAEGLFHPRLPDNWDPRETAQVRHAANTLARLRAVKDRLPIADLVQLALDLTGYEATLLAEFLGERKLANLQKIVQQARVCDASGELALGDFLLQLSEFIAVQPKESLAATHPEDTDVVKLMTIHKSKGLEFPLVVLPDLNRREQASRDCAAYDNEWGPMTKPGEGEEAVVGGLDLYKKLISQQEQAESLRLLYVALTRGADYLILAAGIQQEGQIAKLSAQWLPYVARRFDLLTGQWKSPEPAPPQLPQIRVTLQEPPPPPRQSAPRQLSAAKLLVSLEESATIIHPSADHDDRPSGGSREMGGQTARRNVAKDNTAEGLIEPLAIDGKCRQEFSVSRLSGMLLPATVPIPDEQLNFPPAPGAWDTEYNAAKPFAPSTLPKTNSAFPHRSTAIAAGGPLRPAKALHPTTVAHEDEASFDGREFGILTHAVLAKLTAENLSAAPRLAGSWIERAAEAQEITESTVTSRVARQLEKFWQSPRFAAYRDCREFRTEVEFLLPVPEDPASAPLTGLTRYVRGFLDLLYQDREGAWWIVDYKTTSLNAGNRQAVIAQYEPQLLVYGLAAARGLGIAPAGGVLHFLGTGEEYLLEWNAAREAAAESWIRRAIAAHLDISAE
ncbi:MAG: UvrD-helicase domain-containing protein [Pirellulales bacterium]|nr:UvrD-helicase domain-containing protein [Pirellulales bacterium]